VPPKAKTPAKNPALKKLGQRVRQLRGNPTDLNFVSQEELAARAGIARSYMSAIERGIRNFSVLHLLKLAKALRVPPQSLFYDN
jgi:transcriptional regulator with XRE-family HTH domain